MIRKKISAVVLVAMCAFLAVSCKGKKNADDSPSETTEMATETQTATDVLNTEADDSDASTAEAISQDNISIIGNYENEKYINEMFSFELTPHNDKWSFYTSEELANATSVDKTEIERIWSNDQSVYEQAVSYCAILWNSETGSNIIVNYFCPEQNGLAADFSASEYIDIAKDGYENAVVSTEMLAGISFETLEMVNNDEVIQKLYCTGKDNLILMITVTVTADDDFEECLLMIKENK